MAGKYDKIITQTAREHFARVGYYGSRIDEISETAKINRKLIYDFCRTKEALYMTVLSEVSREVMTAFNHNEIGENTVRGVYENVFSLLENYGDFIRLWTWERMSPTIHGPRILETINAIFEKIRQYIRTRTDIPEFSSITDDQFEAIEALCHGYLLTAAMYFRCDPETDEPEPESTHSIEGSPAMRRLNMSMTIQSIMLDSIEHLIQ